MVTLSALDDDTLQALANGEAEAELRRRREQRQEREQRRRQRERKPKRKEWFQQLSRDDLELLAQGYWSVSDSGATPRWGKLTTQAAEFGLGKSEVADRAVEELSRRRRRGRQEAATDGGVSTGRTRQGELVNVLPKIETTLEELRAHIEFHIERTIERKIEQGELERVNGGEK